MFQKVLESIYEPLFLDVSYGFRPGRSCHDAIKALNDHLYGSDVETIIDVDLANFFGTIDHTLLENILRQKIKDGRFIRYLKRMYKAGVLANGELMMSEEGVPQGSVASPIQANIFAHKVIDEWFETVVKRHCEGRVKMFRYADDMVVCCQYESDAKRIKVALAKRLAKFKLGLNEEKTKFVRFSKREFSQGHKQETFDFLGFTFYLGRTRSGRVVPKIRTSGARMRSKLRKVNEWCRKVRCQLPLNEIWKTFCVKLEGHVQYYGVSYNNARVREFLMKAERTLFKWLNRRSQRKSFSWDRFTLFLRKYPPPKARVCHKHF